MNTTTILKDRKSVRAFMDKKVEKEKLDFILEGLKYTPSGSNMQPWLIHVVQGNTKQIIDEKTLKAFDEGVEPLMDYSYYPEVIPKPYQTRRKETGLLLYESLDIQRKDVEKRRKQWRANYDAFKAPVVLYFFMSKDLTTGSYIDMGMVMQSAVLLAQEIGLSSCVMASLGEYPQIVRDTLEIQEDKLLICGIALGYEDINAKVNNYRTPRLLTEEFVTLHN